ncbi:MAG: GvpL/GvpF family gas vesicle protein [Gemmatimonadota bacterium]|nr:GvpL/GvpF family gas vesicle protein [Gemmatimonadota bacterium]
MADARSAIVYVYGVVAASFDAASAPAGIDGAAVELVREGDVSAVVSRVDADIFAPDLIEHRVTDLDWLGPRARAHDEILTWVSDRGPVVPFPMFALFSDHERVGEALRARGEELRATLARIAGAREFGVRVFRITRELEEHMGELSARVAELEKAARAATPGQRYLLERKLEKERATEARQVSADIARQTLDALAEHARASATEPPPRSESRAGGAILNAFFLVSDDAAAGFRGAVGELSARLSPKGFRFEFTGPWPAYHFAGDRA